MFMSQSILTYIIIMSTCLPFNCVVAFPDVFTYMVDLFESVAKITVLHID